MLWRNGEHYPDPTAGAAFQRIAREEATNEMNEGKRFERDFQASVPPDAWCYRLRDSPVSYYGGSGAEGIRFAQSNLCDFVLYRAPTLYLLELKTVGTPSASLTSLFGKYDPEKRCYQKQRHLQEMAKAEQAAAGLLARTDEGYSFELAKNKRGITGSMKIEFDGRYQTFYEVEDEDI